MRTLGRSVVINHPDSGEFELLLGGSTYEDDDPVIEGLGDHCFEETTESSPDEAAGGTPQYEDMKVPELVELLAQRGVHPESSRKADLIEALEADDAEGTGGADDN